MMGRETGLTVAHAQEVIKERKLYVRQGGTFLEWQDKCAEAVEAYNQTTQKVDDAKAREFLLRFARED